MQPILLLCSYNLLNPGRSTYRTSQRWAFQRCNDLGAFPEHSSQMSWKHFRATKMILLNAQGAFQTTEMIAKPSHNLSHDWRHKYLLVSNRWLDQAILQTPLTIVSHQSAGHGEDMLRVTIRAETRKKAWRESLSCASRTSLTKNANWPSYTGFSRWVWAKSPVAWPRQLVRCRIVLPTHNNRPNWR